LAEWLYEAGIGEARAALVEDGRIVELAIERDDQPGPRAGAILPSRLVRKADASGRGLVTLDGGQSAQLTPVPPGLTADQAATLDGLRQRSLLLSEVRMVTGRRYRRPFALAPDSGKLVIPLD